MTRDEFWKLIDTIDREALRDGDEEGAVEPLIEALAERDPDDILAFEDHLAQALYDIDGRAFADATGESGRSGDGFLYARCYVVACGRKFYESVRADPSRMPDSIDQWCEALLSVAPQAWAQATGQDEDAWDHESPVSYETGSNTTQW